MEQNVKTVELKDLLYRRILLGEKNRGYHNPTKIFAEEYKVLEISPSNQWVKLQNLFGKKFWKPVADCVLLEVLNVYDKPKD